MLEGLVWHSLTGGGVKINPLLLLPESPESQMTFSMQSFSYPLISTPSLLLRRGAITARRAPPLV